MERVVQEVCMESGRRRSIGAGLVGLVALCAASGQRCGSSTWRERLCEGDGGRRVT